MKEKGGRIHRIIKRMMRIIGLLAAVLLCARGSVEAGRAVGKERIMAFISIQADAGLDLIWRINYPAATRQMDQNETKADEIEKKSISGILCRILFEQSPLLRHLGGKRGEEAAYREEDPAYGGYIKSERFYKEHQYLFYDGREETGVEMQEPAMAQIPASNNGDDAADSIKPDENMTYAASALPLAGATYRKEQLADYDFMMKHFYSVASSTTAGRDLMKSEEFLARDFTLEGGADKPQILIYHSHSQEKYADYSSDNEDASVVGIGNYLTELLRAKGYHVIHDVSIYDLKNGKLDRNKAYTYALEGITEILHENPSIEVMLDVHRDGVAESLHLVNEVNGKPTAPIMFFNGVSQTPEGPIEYLPNPYRSDNLAFSFQMQLDSEAYFPGLTRKIYIKGLRYNLHLRPRSALIEVGAQTNTYQEALNAMEPLAEVLNMVLQGN